MPGRVVGQDRTPQQGPLARQLQLVVLRVGAAVVDLIRRPCVQVGQAARQERLCEA